MRLIDLANIYKHLYTKNINEIDLANIYKHLYTKNINEIGLQTFINIYAQRI